VSGVDCNDLKNQELSERMFRESSVDLFWKSTRCEVVLFFRHHSALFVSLSSSVVCSQSSFCSFSLSILGSASKTHSSLYSRFVSLASIHVSIKGPVGDAARPRFLNDLERSANLDPLLLLRQSSPLHFPLRR